MGFPAVGNGWPSDSLAALPITALLELETDRPEF
jgi:hypothetical protein